MNYLTKKIAEVLYAELLRKKEIEMILWDMDDTLVYTSEVFENCMRMYVEYVSSKTGLARDLVMNRLSAINDAEYLVSGVSPMRWQSVVVRLGEELGFAKVMADGLPILMQIYKTELRIRPGANGILDTLCGLGVKNVLVTHANVEWAKWKLANCGLEKYFEAMVIADENGHKSKDDWEKAPKWFGVDLHKCLIVGDSLRGDILPAFELGAKAIWIPSPWSVYRSGNIPEGVATIDDLNEFWEGLEKLN